VGFPDFTSDTQVARTEVLKIEGEVRTVGVPSAYIDFAFKSERGAQQRTPF
jgi:hypothetical protein